MSRSFPRARSKQWAFRCYRKLPFLRNLWHRVWEIVAALHHLSGTNRLAPLVCRLLTHRLRRRYSLGRSCPMAGQDWSCRAYTGHLSKSAQTGRKCLWWTNHKWLFFTARGQAGSFEWTLSQKRLLASSSWRTLHMKSTASSNWMLW